MAEDHESAPDGSDGDPAVGSPTVKRTMGTLEAVFLGLLGLLLVALVILAVASVARG